MMLLTYDSLRERGISYSREHLRRLIAARKFPAPVVLSTRPSGLPARIAWSEHDIDAWLASRAAVPNVAKYAA